MEQLNKRRSTIALREALRNDISFCWFSPIERTVLKHNRAILEALASRREFSYLRTLIQFN